jgi:predicted dehydrogenase
MNAYLWQMFCIFASHNSEMAEETIKFGIIGVGHIGARHAHMIQANPGAELVAIADIRNREDLAMQDFQVPLYENVEEMLMRHSNIQVVCIATPNGYHCQHAIQALNMGCDVVVEKPMALSVDDCDAMIRSDF